MRASEECEELFEVIKSDKKDLGKKSKSKIDWEPYKVNDYSNIKELIKSSDYFLGIREDYVNIYYMGMSMAKIETYYNRACKYSLSYYYAKDIKGYKDKIKGQVVLNPTVFWDERNLELIKNRIEKHVFGKHDNKLRLEKVCQQWIINKNNSNADSKWYFVDMEYICKNSNNNDKNHPFGRADLIAITRKPNKNGKHDVAFVELKVGTNSYSGQRDSEEKMEVLLNESLYKINDIKLGSGLASHMVDFMHFFANTFFVDQVKDEIIGILDWHKKFKLISNDSDLGRLSSIDKIEDKPSIQIVTYSSVPGVTIDKLADKCKNNYTNVSLKSMKESFYKYMYDSSMAFIDIVNNDDIRDIVDKKYDFEKFKDNNESQIKCQQCIDKTDKKDNKNKYDFIFRFIEVDDMGNCEDCII